MSRLRPAHPGDWLLVVGDVAEESRVVLDVLAELRQRFARVIWVPGNHELWTHPLDRDDRRGRMSPSPVQPTVTMSSSSTTTRRCGTVWVRRFDSSSGSSDADATRVVSLSLPIGSRRHTDNITLKDWNALAFDCDLEPDHVVNIVSDVNQRLSSQLDPATGEATPQPRDLLDSFLEQGSVHGPHSRQIHEEKPLMRWPRPVRTSWRPSRRRARSSSPSVSCVASTPPTGR
ncbi:metallophosphoesterase [Arachnia propionica]|uniref:metallophosphoesterase n=1 Tax=Arachnia propionica TaxID=1750 RepID=UPI003CCE8E7E